MTTKGDSTALVQQIPNQEKRKFVGEKSETKVGIAAVALTIGLVIGYFLNSAVGVFGPPTLLEGAQRIRRDIKNNDVVKYNNLIRYVDANLSRIRTTDDDYGYMILERFIARAVLGSDSEARADYEKAFDYLGKAKVERYLGAQLAKDVVEKVDVLIRKLPPYRQVELKDMPTPILEPIPPTAIVRIVPVIPTLNPCLPRGTIQPLISVSGEIGPRNSTADLTDFYPTIFYTWTMTVENFNGNEHWCLVSSESGSRLSEVDDLIRIQVTGAAGVRTCEIDFAEAVLEKDAYYCSKPTPLIKIPLPTITPSGAIIPRQTMDISELFSNGVNIIQINFIDTRPSFNSAKPLYFLIWK